MNPLLTVVVPVFNRSNLIERTLDSIAASTYRLFVLKIIDNASTDNSLEVCQRWAERNASADGLVIEVFEETKAGAPCARNCGLASCQTPYIYFFDSDDFCSPDFIGDVLMAFEKEDANLLPLSYKDIAAEFGVKHIKDDEQVTMLYQHLYNQLSKVCVSPRLRSLIGQMFKEEEEVYVVEQDVFPITNEDQPVGSGTTKDGAELSQPTSKKVESKKTVRVKKIKIHN